MNNKKLEIIIDNNNDHEGKFQIEIITSKGNSKFIKNYKLSNNQLNFLINYLNERNILFKFKNDIYHGDKRNEVVNNKHPEYKNNQLFTLDSYRQTINAKYGDSVDKNISKCNDTLMASNEIIEEDNLFDNQIRGFDNMNSNYNSYMSQSDRSPK